MWQIKIFNFHFLEIYLVLLVIFSEFANCSTNKSSSFKASSSFKSTKKLLKVLSFKGNSDLPNKSEFLKFQGKLKNMYDALKPEPNVYAKNRYVLRAKISEKMANQVLNELLKMKDNQRPPKYKGNFLRIFFDDGKRIFDYGGLTRRWFTLVSTQMKHPDFGLFQYCDYGQTEIVPDDNINSKYIKQYEAVGIFIGLAIYHRCLLNVSFSKPFLKSILGRKIELSDIKTADKKLYRELFEIKKSDPSDKNIKYYKKSSKGTLTKVTEKNKDDYISNVISEKYVKSIEKPIKAILSGLESVIPLNLVKQFTEEELDWLIGGKPTVNIDDWKENTKFVLHEENVDIKKSFWKMIKKHTDLQIPLLEFVTGSPRLPAIGFSGLELGFTDKEWPPFTIEIVSTDEQVHPTSDTNRRILFLPFYESEEKMTEMLKKALGNISENFK